MLTLHLKSSLKKRQNHKKRKHSNGFQRLGAGGMTTKEEGILGVMEMFCVLNVVMVM